MADAKGQIGFDELGLAGVLKQYRLRVPPNQREYAWEDEQVNQLLRDLAKAIEDGETYFLGTILTIPRDDGTLEVVDGQQRLATTAIFLAAISAYLAGSNENEIATAIDTELLTGSDRSRRGRVPKLALNIDDNELFKQIVTRTEPLPEPTRESHRLLLDAWEKAKEQVTRVVAPFDRRDHGDTLNRWVNFMEDDARVILLRVPDDANAYKMFETLNDRGLRSGAASGTMARAAKQGEPAPAHIHAYARPIAAVRRWRWSAVQCQGAMSTARRLRRKGRSVLYARSEMAATSGRDLRPPFRFGQ
jgi:Protein of unknown function DUF262